MIAARVIDNIWATRKVDSLRGFKLMLVEVLDESLKGSKLIAVDEIGAGIGERVIIVTGSAARRMVGNDSIPVDAAIVGIIDEDCTF